ncbi:MAG: hypothetical protein U9Q82_10680 [Chloroflexota bacterium]|nr:hypothetical protein [Chloroflexota bacterium]
MTDIRIRPYRPADEAAIETITYRTGFNGEDRSQHFHQCQRGVFAWQKQ